MEQMIADTVEAADYLRARFGQDRILLLGHSWGSYLGSRSPPPRRTGSSPMSGWHRSRISCAPSHGAGRILIGAYRERGDAAMVRRLKGAPVSMENGLSPEWMRLRDRAMHGMGVGHTHDMNSVITGIFMPVWRVRAYTVMDKINVWRGKLWSRPFFWDDLLKDDLSKRLTEFELPVYLLRRSLRLHRQSQAFPRVFRSNRRASEAVLRLRELRAQPAVRGACAATQILLEDVMGGSNGGMNSPLAETNGHRPDTGQTNEAGETR